MTPESIRAAADAFRESYQPGNVCGLLVAGSGLSLEVPGWEAAEVVEFGDVFDFPMHELVGHSQTMTLWRRGDESLMVMNGRFHLYQGYRPEEVVAPVRLAGLLGAKVLIATNASGALDPDMKPGSLVIVNDHINLQGSNPLVGDWGRDFGPPFPDMSAAYDPELRQLALDAAAEAGFDAREGVYCAMLGPSFETPAEIRTLIGMGGLVVGMSTVPEVIAARQMGMRVCVLSLAANPAAGLVDRELTHQEVMDEGEKAAERLRVLLGALVDSVF
jgi:purine-nucleoside phosphorylase